MFASVDTRLPPGLTRPDPDHWPDKTLPYGEFWNAYEAWRGNQHPTPPPKTPDTPDT
jgi:hypothetical protein